MWSIANMLIKLSILDLYAWIFREKWLQHTAHVLMALAVLYSAAATLEIFLICQPLASFWNPMIPGGHCGNLRQAWLAVGITNLLLDVFTILLPLPVLWSLKLATKCKVGLSVIFSLGLL